MPRMSYHLCTHICLRALGAGPLHQLAKQVHQRGRGLRCVDKLVQKWHARRRVRKSGSYSVRSLRRCMHNRHDTLGLAASHFFVYQRTAALLASKTR